MQECPHEEGAQKVVNYPYLDATSGSDGEREAGPKRSRQSDLVVCGEIVVQGKIGAIEHEKDNIGANENFSVI